MGWGHDDDWKYPRNIFHTTFTTPSRRQSKTLLTIDERGSKIAKNSVFDCYLSPIRRQMTIKNSVSSDFWSTYVDSINVYDCHLPGVITYTELTSFCKSLTPTQLKASKCMILSVKIEFWVYSQGRSGLPCEFDADLWWPIPNQTLGDN